jgi:hypothetical protein
LLLQAVHHANRTGAPTFDTVRFYLEAHKLVDSGKGKDTAACVNEIVVDKPRLADYDALFTKEGDSYGGE